jgi:hypothetical protein
MNIVKLEQPLTDNTGLVQASLLQLLRDWEHEAMVQGASSPGIWQETYEALYHTSYVVRVRSMEVTIYRTSREGVFGRLVEDSKGDLYEEMNYKIEWNWAGCGSRPLDETKDMLTAMVWAVTLGQRLAEFFRERSIYRLIATAERRRQEMERDAKRQAERHLQTRVISQIGDGYKGMRALQQRQFANVHGLEQPFYYRPDRKGVAYQVDVASDKAQLVLTRCGILPADTKVVEVRGE